MRDSRDEIIELLDGCSLEITPGAARKISSFKNLLQGGTRVFVTFIAGSDFNDTIDTSVRLASEGLTPVPHLAARSFPSREFLEKGLARLRREADISEALVIAGGVDEPLGEFSSTMEVLESGLLQEYGITRIGVAGHPEGNPDIPEAEVARAIREKNTFAREHALDMYIVTQFVFEAKPIIEWEQRLRDEGNALPIHIGLPGLATLGTLISHARDCGIGASMRVLTRQSANLTRLMTTRTPDKLVRDLAEHRAGDPDCAIAGCHLYPLGGFRKSVKWLQAIEEGQFELNSTGGFDATVKIE